MIEERLLLDNLEITIAVLGENVLPLVPNALELVDVLRMDLIHILGVRTLLFAHHDRSASDDVERTSVRHHTNIVVENATSVEKRNCETQSLLDQQLELVDGGMCLRIELLIEFILAKRQYGNEISTSANGELDETLATSEHKTKAVGLSIQRFASTANNDGDGATHTFPVGATLGENVLATLARNRGQAQAQSVVAIQGDAEVRVQGQESVGDTGEQLRKAESFGREGDKGTVADNTVWMIAKDVLAGCGQLLRTVKASREV